jgi:hypothetical protein
MKHNHLIAHFALSLAALGGLAGCDEDDFDPVSRVVDFRVLAVKADAPYARPGETVHLSSLSHDPTARPITWAWAACVNPSSSSVEGCLEKVAEDAAANPTSPILAMGVGQTSFDFTIPADALASVDSDALPLALTGIVSVACPGELAVVASPSNPLRCREPGSGRELGLDEYVVGIKRVFMRATDRNQNPAIADVRFDGASWPEAEVKEVDACDIDDNVYDDCSKSLRHQIAAVATPESYEAGVDEFGYDFEEQVIVQYYASEGIFEFDSRIAEDPETGWVARTYASGQELDMWFVIRDDRGGVTWTQRRVRVR